MTDKIVIALAFIAVANAAVIVPTAPLVKSAIPAVSPVLAKTVELEEYDPHPQYQYGYNIRDSLSGDSKGHVEERDGDLVRGEYSLIDADGFKRTVTYTADPINGFNAVVRREPLVVATPVVKVPALPTSALRAAPLAVTPAAPAPIIQSLQALNPLPLRFSAPIVPASLPFADPTYAIRNL